MTLEPETRALEPDEIQRVVLVNPFDSSERRIERLAYKDGAPLSAYLEGYIGSDLVIVHNGQLVDPGACAAIVPRPSDSVVVGRRVGSASVWRTIGSIAIMALAIIVSVWFAPAVLGLGALASALFGAGVAVAGNLILAVVARPPSPAGRSDSNSYLWDGPQMTIGEGSPIPKGYGKFSPSWHVIASYTSYEFGQSYLNLLLSAGFGPATAIDNIKINGNDIATYTDVTYDTRLGTNTQAPVAYFYDVRNQRAVAQKIVSGANIVSNHVRTDTEAVEVEISFPKGLWAGPNSDGSFDQWTVFGTVELSSDGGSTWGSPTSWSMAQNVQSPQRTVVRIDSLTPGAYEVRVTKIGSGQHPYSTPSTAFESNTRRGEETWVQTITEIVYDDLAYPNLVLLGIRALATNQLSGAGLNVTADVTWDVPAIYFDALDAFGTDNPARIARDILCNPLYGGAVPLARITPYIQRFLDWGNFCDEIVPADTIGGTIKRAMHNGVFDETGSVWEAVQRLASLGHAAIMRTGRGYTCITDNAAVPTQQFNISNMVAGSFRETWLATADRANQVEVQYYDETDGYKRKTITIIDEAQVALDNSVRPAGALDMRGCTKAAQAWREGTYRLLATKYLRRGAEWDASIDAVAAQVGDVMSVGYDLVGWGTGGRVVSAADTTHVTLDKPVTLVGGHSYVLQVTLNGGTQDVVETRAITAVSLDGLTVTLATALTAVPLVNDLWTFGESSGDSNVVRNFRVLQIGRTSEHLRHIVAVEYNPLVYADLDPVLPEVDIVNDADLQVTNLHVNPLPSTSGMAQIGIGWTPGRLDAGAVVFIQQGDATEAFVRRVPQSAGAATLASVRAGVACTVRVVGYNGRGLSAKHSTAPTATLTPLLIKLGVIAGGQWQVTNGDGELPLVGGVVPNWIPRDSIVVGMFPTVSYETVSPIAGTQSLKIEWPGNSGSVYHDTWFKIDAGSQQILKFSYINHFGVTITSYIWYVDWLGNKLALGDFVGLGGDTAGAVAVLEHVFTPPDGAYYAFIEIHQTNILGTDTILTVDNVTAGTYVAPGRLALTQTGTDGQVLVRRSTAIDGVGWAAGAAGGGVNVVAFSATPTFDLSLGAVQKINGLTGNITGMTISNASSYKGQRFTFVFVMDGTGGRSVAWAASVKGGGQVADADASKTFVQNFTVDDASNLLASDQGMVV